MPDCRPKENSESEIVKPWLANYERYDYRYVWRGKRLEDAAQKHIITSWLTRGESCLELGAGFGRITRILEPKFNQVVALELVDRSLALARNNLKRAQLAKADISSLPLQESSFDCVVMVRVIHLLPDPMAVMTEVLRVAKHGATVIVSMPNLPVNNLIWEAKRLATKDKSIGPFVWPFGSRPRFVDYKEFMPKAFELRGRRGTGLFDNPVGRLFNARTRVYLFDIATSPLWFTKLDIFLRFRVAKK